MITLKMKQIVAYCLIIVLQYCLNCVKGLIEVQSMQMVACANKNVYVISV